LKSLLPRMLIEINNEEPSSRVKICFLGKLLKMFIISVPGIKSNDT
jgi:hypothetical protein